VQSDPHPAPLQQLRDADAWPRLEATPCALLAVGSASCGACRRLRAMLPALAAAVGLPALWAEAEDAPGLVAELEVFHLPALFVVAAGEPIGEVQAPLQLDALRAAIEALRSGR
jgi:thioredoxin-like negative regulator of GroEL